LLAYKDILEFKYEYQLTTEPLRIDIPIILKPRTPYLDKNIARIFKTINVFEYKSPEDYLSVKDFYKVYAYAALYAAITPKTALSDITITMVGRTYPRNLITYFTEVRHYQVEPLQKGIYYIIGDYLPIQIIVSADLSPSDNRWLKHLGRDLEKEEAERIFKEGVQLPLPMDAYYDVLIRANLKTFEEVIAMSDDTLSIEDILMRTGFIPKWLAQGRKEGREEGREESRKEIALNLLKKGWTVEETAETAGLAIEKVRALSALMQ
jgi:hypothetical protein